MECITLLVSIAALCVAIFIPRRIMINQIYADLMSQYRTPEMGGAILSIFHFYKYYCKEKIEKIESKYEEIYEKQIKNWFKAEKEAIEDKEAKSYKMKPIDFSNTLHFQRRQVAQFYFNMASLRYDFHIVKLSKRFLKTWFTAGDVKLLSIILHMAKAVENVSIKIGNVPLAAEDETPMNQLIHQLHEEVSEWV